MKKLLRALYKALRLVGTILIVISTSVGSIIFSVTIMSNFFVKFFGISRIAGDVYSLLLVAILATIVLSTAIFYSDDNA